MYDFFNVEQYNDLSLNQVHLALISKNFLDRCDTLEFLVKFAQEPKIQQIAMEMLDDSNYLVRCSAYEILMYSSSEKVLKSIIKKLGKEKNRITRMYAVSSICNIIKNGSKFDIKTVGKLRALFENEHSSCVIIAYYSVFYLIDKDISYIRKILKFINNKSYHIRCNVINIILDILDEDNHELIFDTFEKRYNIEESEAVKSLLQLWIANLSESCAAY